MNDSLEVLGGCTAGQGLTSRVPLRPGDVVFDLADATPVPAPDRYSIQVGVDEHVDAGAVRYLNHSCAPNTVIDTVRRRVVAAAAIPAGGELTFFYPATEWDMACPFPCRCGTELCLGQIRGARHVTPDVLARYEVGPHIRLLHQQLWAPGTAARVAAR